MTDFAMVILWNSALAGGLACVVFLFQRHRWLKTKPGLAYWLWLMVLVKLVTPPLVFVPLVKSVSQTPVATQVAGDEGLGIRGDFSIPETLVVASESDSFFWSTSVLLCTAAMLGTFGMLGLYWFHSRRVSRLVRLGEPAPAWVQKLTNDTAHDMRVNQTASVLLVQAQVSPFLWVSRGKPHIVLPSALVHSMDREKLHLVIRHELMHYLRRDHWTNLFSSMVIALQWWNPMAWWARRELRFAQELCCDAAVLALEHVVRRSYAETLFQTVDFVASSEAAVSVPATAFSSCSTFKRRIEMISQKDLFSGVPRMTRMLVIPLGVLMLVTSPTFADDEDRADEIARMRGQIRELQSTVEDLRSIVHEFAEKRMADRTRDNRRAEREREELREAWRRCFLPR